MVTCLFRRSSIILLVQPARKSSTPESRSAPLTLSCAWSKRHVTVVRSIGRAPTLVLRLSYEPTQRRSICVHEHELDQHGDNQLRRNGSNFSLPRSSTARPFHSSPASRRGPLSDFPESKGTWSRERFRMGPSRCTSRPPAIPPLPRDVSVRPRPSPRLENPSYGPRCSLSLCLNRNRNL